MLCNLELTWKIISQTSLDRIYQTSHLLSNEFVLPISYYPLVSSPNFPTVARKFDTVWGSICSLQG
jgi:hypothetical protein